MAETPIRIEIVSDVVCPWCYLGQRRLKLALERLEGEVAASITWKPFQLEPNAPPEGFDTLDYLSRKIGGADAVRQSHEQLTRMGAEIGLPFALDKARKFPNTLDAHRLAHWAGLESAELQDQVMQALFRANFVEGRNVGDREVLLQIAEEAGMDRATVERKLSDGTDVETIRGEIEHAQRIGVTGVPCFIIDQRYAVTGAQPVELFENGLRQIAQEKAQQS
jgi:predicted DsbA family dithiol-disulfide isomerase